MAPFEVSRFRTLTSVTLQLSLVFCGLLSFVGDVDAQTANQQQYPERGIHVAIVGAVRGTPASYELPAGSTVAQAVERVGGADPSATGRFRLFRGSLFEDSDQSLPLLDGDVVIVLSSRPSPAGNPAVVLTMPGERPLVLSLSSFDATRAGVRSKLPAQLAAATTILNSRSLAPLDDGAIVAINASDRGFWSRMATALPSVAYEAPKQLVAVAPQPVDATFVAPAPAMVAANAPVALTPLAAPPQSTAVLPPSLPDLPQIEPATNKDSTLASKVAGIGVAETPTPAPERILVPVIPKSRVPDRRVAASSPLPTLPPRSFASSASDSPARQARPRVVSIEPITVQTTTITRTAPASPAKVAVKTKSTSSSSIQPISGPASDGVSRIMSSNPNPFDPSTSAAAIDSKPAKTTPASTGTLLFVGISAALAFIVSGIYLVVQTYSSDSATERQLDLASDDSVPDVTELPVVQENAPIDMPMSIVGRTVALGHIRIDSAHEQPSGPHFGRSGETRSPGTRSTEVASSIPEGDVFGRALAAMERERMQ